MKKTGSNLGKELNNYYMNKKRNNYSRMKISKKIKKEYRRHRRVNSDSRFIHFHPKGLIYFIFINCPRHVMLILFFLVSASNSQMWVTCEPLVSYLEK
jgi:hypothetical protein